MGVLLVVLTAQVLFAEGEGSTVVTQPVGTAQDRAEDIDGSNEQPAPPDAAPGTGERGTGSSGDSEGSVGPGDTTGEEPTAEDAVSGSVDRMNDPAYVTERIAEGFVHDFRGVIDVTEARCMADVVVGMFGIDRLWQITQAMADANADPASFDRSDPRFLSDAEADALNAQLRPCVSGEDAARLNLNG